MFLNVLACKWFILINKFWNQSSRLSQLAVVTQLQCYPLGQLQLLNLHPLKLTHRHVSDNITESLQMEKYTFCRIIRSFLLSGTTSNTSLTLKYCERSNYFRKTTVETWVRVGEREFGVNPEVPSARIFFQSHGWIFSSQSRRGNNNSPLARFQSGTSPWTRLVLLVRNRLHYLTKRSVSVGVISTVFLDYWSNNLSLSVAQTSTYWGHSHSKGLCSSHCSWVAAASWGDLLIRSQNFC